MFFLSFLSTTGETIYFSTQWVRAYKPTLNLLLTLFHHHINNNFAVVGITQQLILKQSRSPHRNASVGRPRQRKCVGNFMLSRWVLS
jgi:hypothetical protein